MGSRKPIVLSMTDAGVPFTTAPEYAYTGTVIKWCDGDTVDMTVDLGFHITVNYRFRLYGVDTPERGEMHHDEAWELSKSLAPEGSLVNVQVYKHPEKYGRMLAVITYQGKNIAQELIATGLADPYYGGTKATHQKA